MLKNGLMTNDLHGPVWFLQILDLLLSQLEIDAFYNPWLGSNVIHVAMHDGAHRRCP